MTAIAAIRTHRWGEDEARLHAQLAPVFGDRLAVAFHDRPKDLALPLPVVDIDDAWLQAAGLRRLDDWGWRCGDYFLYALRQAMPGADHYWLIEPDVWFAGPVAEFFARAAVLPHDLLGVRIERMRPEHRFARSLKPLEPWRAIFALTRLSGRAIDRLFDLRRAYSAQRLGPAVFANDEVFCHSHVAVDPELSRASLAELMPEWFQDCRMETDPDILFDTLEGQAGPGVWHPVRGRASFAAALAARLAANTGFLPAMAPSLARLEDREITQVARTAARRLRETLLAARAAARGEGGR